MKRGREAGVEVWREGGVEGGREVWRVGGREVGKKGGVEERREEGGRKERICNVTVKHFLVTLSTKCTTTQTLTS